MKKIYLLFLFLFIGTILLAQNEPILNVGAGYPVFFKESLYNHGTGEATTSINGLHLFIEKPDILNLTKLQNLTVTPGVFYLAFSEGKKSPETALGGYSSGSYKHRSFGLQSKFLLHVAEFSKQRNRLYAGLLLGIHLHTKTKGSESGGILYNPPLYWDSETNGDGKHFFGSHKAGLILGIKPAHSGNLRLHPALELAFYPYYARLIDYYSVSDEEYNDRESMISISLLLGFGAKKELPD